PYFVLLLSALPFFFFSSSRDRRALHSFPTRRSSDLAASVPMWSVLSGRPGDMSLGNPDTSSAFSSWSVADTCSGTPFFHAPLVSDRKSTRLNSSHVKISYAVFCLKKKKKTQTSATHV